MAVTDSNGNGGRIEVEGVGLTFTSPTQDPVVALEDVNLVVEPGEFVCVVGASGSGKSTLLRAIDGLLPPTAGRVLIDGTEVTEPGRDRAMVFQSDNLMPWSTVEDNVAYGLRI